jgi:hypothetical protein
MTVRIHPHAKTRMAERGATEAEVVETVRFGESFTAKLGRYGFRRNFVYNSLWRGKSYATKQVEAIAVEENDDWLVISVIVKFF